jgi:hypothetical protein
MLCAAAGCGRSHHAPAAISSRSKVAPAAIVIRRRAGKAEWRRAGAAAVAGSAPESCAIRLTSESIDLSQPSKASIHWRVDNSYAKASLGSTSSILSAITGTR